MRLQTEYAIRCGFTTNAVLSVHEGLYAFVDRESTYFVHTGIRPKLHKFCAGCVQPGYAIDIFTLGFTYLNSIAHGHIKADENLVPIVQRMLRSKHATLIKISRRSEAEFIIWKSYLAISDLENNETWQDLTNPLKKDDGKLTPAQIAAKQMGLCAINFNSYYQCYYQQLGVLLTGRKFVDLGENSLTS